MQESNNTALIQINSVINTTSSSIWYEALFPSWSPLLQCKLLACDCICKDSRWYSVAHLDPSLSLHGTHMLTVFTLRLKKHCTNPSDKLSLLHLLQTNFSNLKEIRKRKEKKQYNVDLINLSTKNVQAYNGVRECVQMYDGVCCPTKPKCRNYTEAETEKNSFKILVLIWILYCNLFSETGL